MKIQGLSIAACLAGLALAACETSTYASGGVIGAAIVPAKTRPFAGSYDLGRLAAAPVSTGAIETAAAQTAAPTEALVNHETKASALWTGRAFLAAGKVLAAPARETLGSAVAEELPAGWRRADNRLVHRQSGLECPLEFDFSEDGKGAGVLSLKDITAYDEAGRDVSCNYANGGASLITVYAAFYPEISVEDHAAAAVAAMRQTFMLKTVLPVVSVEIEDKDAGATTADLEPPIAGAFDIGEINGEPYKTALWIAKTQGWHVKARATYAQADITSELVAAVIFAANYLNVDMKNKADPTTTGPDV